MRFYAFFITDHNTKLKETKKTTLFSLPARLPVVLVHGAVVLRCNDVAQYLRSKIIKN
jgi:hypothetical protein